MFSSQFTKLVAQNKSAWKAGLVVVTVGLSFKVRWSWNLLYTTTTADTAHFSFGGLLLYSLQLFYTWQVVYFNFSRGLMIDHMDARHHQATEHLRDRRDLASKMAKERQEKAPPLTPEQKQQLEEYLKLMKASQPDVYPKESGRWD